MISFLGIAEFVLVGSSVYIVYYSFHFPDDYQVKLENTYGDGLYILFQTVTIVLGIISSMILLSNLYLIGFHIYLKCYSLSTYQYITNKRPEAPPMRIVPSYELPLADKEISKKSIEIHLETKVHKFTSEKRNDDTFSDNEITKLNTIVYKK